MTESSPPAEARKVVTVLFSDVTGSTALGQALDPESLRRLMARYFDRMRAIVHRHGGTTEKFIGDALMAIFGVPQLHEDDALRASRAAVEMRQALAELNEEFQRTYGVRIAAHTGVNTGEVIAGDPGRGESFVVGDAVNVAARLEQSADSGQILIGEATYRLIRDAATADELLPLSVKGKPEPILAWNLLEIAPQWGSPARRLDAPLVGRGEHMAVLQEVFERAIQRRGCELVTVMGVAGVGKSRLTDEFLTTLVAGTRVLKGRCLPYGDGITFWPIVGVLREAAGISDLDSPEEARPKMSELLGPAPDAPLIGERLAALLGLSDVTPGIQETFWAVRKLFEELASRRPVVVVFDDIHWGEATFLDLLEYVVDWVRDVPLMIVCMARPELLEVRGQWMTAKSNASLLALPSLTDSETSGLIEHLLGGGHLAGEARARIAEVAEGNPLFVEETLRMLVDDGLLQRSNGSWTVTGNLSRVAIPPTIHALLTARLDRLATEERAVIERASVIGRVFSWDAVSELSPEPQRGRVGSGLQSLSRKELIRPDHSDLVEEDAFRFTHILIRDAAYGGIPKGKRAELHERLADRIEAKARGRAGEYEEILGHHLEQAYRALSELGPVNDRIQALGQRASIPLASAGRRAFARGDMPAAVNLLSRAVSFHPQHDLGRLQLLPDLAFALLETSDIARMQAVVAETAQSAEVSEDPTLQAQALILGLWMRVFTDPEGWAEEAFKEATAAISTFEAHHDERGLARAWSLLGLVHLFTCRFAMSEDEWEKAAAHAHAGGYEREELEYLSWVPLVAWGGPKPVVEGIGRCREILERAAGDRKAMSTALFTMGKLEAMQGRFVEARELIARARAILREISLTVWMAGPLTQMSGWVDILAGDPSAAEADLRWGVATLREIGEFSWMSTVAGILAEALYAQGRDQDADEFIRLCEETAGSEDVYSHALARSVRAKVLARQGRAEEAERWGREAIAIAEPTDFLFVKAFASISLGEALVTAGRVEQSKAVLAEALDVCEQKGFAVGSQRARALLERQAPEQS